VKNIAISIFNIHRISIYFILYTLIGIIYLYDRYQNDFRYFIFIFIVVYKCIILYFLQIHYPRDREPTLVKFLIINL